MAYFNAFQLVLLFAVGPYAITYVNDASFYAHTVLFWVLVASYVAGFSGLVCTVGEKFDK